jgi:hypothetical protein
MTSFPRINRTWALALTRMVTVVGAFGLSFAMTPTAQAEMSLSLLVNNSFIKSEGFDVISENDHLGQAELSAAMQLLPLLEGSLWGEMSYLAGASQSTSFNGALKASALLQGVTCGGIFKLERWTWFVPRARIGLGFLVGSMEFEPVSADTATDRAWALTGHVLAGFELLWPRRRPGVNAGLVVEAGYGFSSNLGFDLAPEEDEKNLRIPLTGSALGSLGLSGAQLRAGVMVKF